jgi:CDP-diacylglycerol pyrophosphatase
MSPPNRKAFVRTYRRMRFLLTVLAVGLIALSGASRGRADPGQSSPDCGDWNDTGGRFYLWDQVKKRTPTDRGTNLEVVFPDPARDYGYAVHNGAHGAPSTYDLLLLPTNRVSGIECPKIWAPNALNLWQYARDTARRIPSGTNIALGINSAEQRDQDQLHIHVSRIIAGAKTDIDNQRKLITSDPAKWKATVISVQGKDFRSLHVPDLNTNLFALLRQYVAPKDMFAQAMLVVPDPSGGYDVLDSQYSLSTHGIRNIEFLLDKHA